jgi:hypothetical protein
MNRKPQNVLACGACAVLVCLGLQVSGYAGSKTLGQLEFVPATKIDSLAGVWVDGAYVGYVSELKGSDKLLLVPGEHQITIRYAGYLDLASRVAVSPATVLSFPVRLERDPRALNAETSAEMRIIVKPNRAAVFLNGGYVGHVDEFDGPGQAMLLPPGTYSVRIALPGYSPLETQVTLVPTQKFELKTHLFPAGMARAR